MTATGSQEPRNRARPAPATPAGSDLASQIALVARGETTAFDAVFEQIGPSVFGVVKRVIRDPAQSEEVTQEVMLEVWRSASKFDPGQGVRVANLAPFGQFHAQPHSGTPRQSRSRISASRILVFTVPVGTPSRLATWP